MSPSILSLAIGLIAANPVPPLAWPEEPAQAGAATAAERPAPAAAGARDRAVILLSNGNLKVHEGTIAEEGNEYVLKHRSGSVRLPKRDVERIFESIEGVYAFKVESLPDRDPDEHMKLALWCLSQKLPAQAEEQLRAVLAYTPGDRRALGMLKNIQSMAERRQQRDEGVERTSIEAVEEPRRAGSAPDQVVIDQIRSYRGPMGKPVVFDLPEGLAARRYLEFNQTIHGLLQNACARCHDENSGRNFQMIRARSSKDMGNDLFVKNNLDATLGLIDRTNPAHSPLLVNAVTPHGPERKPVLPDPNSVGYRALWSWVESLRHMGVNQSGVGAPTPASAPEFTPAPAPGEADGAGFGGGFASGRGAAPVAPDVVVGPPGAAPYPVPDASTVRVEQQQAVHPSVPGDADFQTVSPLLGNGPNTAAVKVNSRRAGETGADATSTGAVQVPAGRPSLSDHGELAPPPGTTGSATGAASGGGGQTVAALPDGSELITRPDGSQFLKLKDGTLAPVLDKSAVKRAKPVTDRKKGKNVQIDPRLLERFQQSIMRPPAP